MSKSKSRVSAALFVLASALCTTANANTAPSIAGTPASWVYVGSAYSFRPTATDPDSTSLRFTIANKPAWASFNTTSGQLAGTPTTVGWWTNVRISVSDGSSTRSLPDFSIRATSRDTRAPVISGSPATAAVINVAYAFQPKASDVDGDPLRFSIANKPAWATFNPVSGGLSGTPTAASVGTYANITIAVTDGSQKVSLAPFS